MKKYFLLSIAILCLVIAGCKKKVDEVDKTGSIYGTITDFATGEPVKNANVQLRPGGETTLTGYDGMYEFIGVADGEYSIIVSKAEYNDLIDDYVISVKDGQRKRRDVQIQKQSAVLSIVDNNQNPIRELNFGSSNGVNQKTFNIFNSGTVNLHYTITKTAAWITSITPSSGVINMGSTLPITVVINRSVLSEGENTTTIAITTTNAGGVELVVKAVNDGGNISDLVVTLTSANLMVQKIDLGCFNYYTAEILCENSNVANYNDWRLPTLDELLILYNFKEVIGGFHYNDYDDETKYWSSTNLYNEGYYTIDFYSGYTDTDYDYTDIDHRVRAVRSLQ